MRGRKLWGATLIDQVDRTRYSCLAKVCGIVGYVHRAVKKWLAHVSRTSRKAKWEATLTVEEHNAALQDVCLAAQNRVTYTVTMLNILVSSNEGSVLLRCHSTVQAINQGGSSVPLVLYNAWISNLLKQEALIANHESVARTLLQVRSKTCVVLEPRIAR